MESLADFARAYDELGDSERAFAQLNEEYGGDAVGYMFDPVKLTQWQQMYAQVEKTLGEGGTLNATE